MPPTQELPQLFMQPLKIIKTFGAMDAVKVVFSEYLQCMRISQTCKSFLDCPSENHLMSRYKVRYTFAYLVPVNTSSFRLFELRLVSIKIANSAYQGTIFHLCAV
jgi:hypothetical protein